MSESASMRTGGQVLADQLKIHGVDTAFCVPGESYLAVLDGLYDTKGELDLAMTLSAAPDAVSLRGVPGDLVSLMTAGDGQLTVTELLWYLEFK